jgi:conjugal transfer pilus assembly protein TraE
MKASDLGKEIAARTGIKVAFQLMLLGSVVTNLLLAVGVLTADRTHRETLVPPMIHQTFWVENDRVSGTYLEEMGLFILTNALDVTPASAEFQARQILKYADPKSYGVLEKDLLANAVRMKEGNVSTFFAVNSRTLDEPNQTIAFTGTLSTILGDKTVSSEPKAYSIKFGMKSAKVVLLELRETSVTAPLGVPASVPAAAK